MKILFLTHSLPWPLHEGVRLHVYHLLKELSTRHELHLVSFIEREEEQQHRPRLAPFCRSIRLVRHTVPKQPWKRLWNIFAQKDPFSVLQFASLQMEGELRKTIEEVRPDMLHVDFTVMAPYAQAFPNLPTLFFPHDAMSMLFERNVSHERNPFFRWYLAAQARKMARFESRVLPLFDRSIVVSPVDQAVLQQRCPAAHVDWIPNGVDTDYFKPQCEDEQDLIVFRGILSFLPNADAARFFATDVMPILWESSPGTRFAIVGDRPPKDLIRLSQRDRRIELRGYVPDLRTVMAQAAVIACPMRIGSGIKNKILESMAMGKAIVATPMSLAGISAKAGEHLLVGTHPEELAGHTRALLQDVQRRRQLGDAARRFVEIHHRWADHAARFSRAYEAVIAGRSTNAR